MAAYAYFSNGGGAGSAGTTLRSLHADVCSSGNSISQQTRVQLSQFTKLTYRPTVQQQLHFPKREGRGVPRGRQLVPTPGCALLCHQGHLNFPEPQCPCRNT